MKKREWNSPVIKLVGSALLFLGAMVLVFYYLFGAANRFLTSDTADSLLWAQASYEAKTLINPDFSYATMLPLGMHLLMVPFIAIFGLSIAAQSWGMFVFFLLLVGSMVFCLRSFSWNFARVFTASAFLILLTLISPATRMLMYGHILYYSQGLMYLFVGLGLLLRMIKANDQKKYAKANFMLVCLSLWMLCTAINGEMTLAIFTVPLIGAYTIEQIFCHSLEIEDRRPDRYSWRVIAMLIVSSLAGLAARYIICRGLRASYAESVTSMAASIQWKEHVENLLDFWMQLITGQTTQNAKILSGAGMITIFQLMAGFILAIVPFMALLRYQMLKERWERLLVLAHWVTTGVILFLFVFTHYGEAAWRLLPVFLTSVVVTFMYVRHMLLGQSLLIKRLAILVSAVMAVNAAWSGLFIIQLPSDYYTANAYGFIAFLEQNGLTDGYATYWNASGTTVHADDRVHIRPIIMDSTSITPQHFQSNANWYTQPLSSCFLLVTAQDAKESEPNIPPDYLALLYYGEDRIFVYDHNILMQ